MLCKNLNPWAGQNFFHDIGAQIELEDEVAVARVAAGLASPIFGDDQEKEREAFNRRVEAHKRKAATAAAAA